MKTFIVRIGIIEPWEFPWELLAAEIQEKENDCLLINLREKIRYKLTDVNQLIAEPRSHGESLDDIAMGREIVICLTPIAGETLRPMNECVELAKKWRGWFLLGSIAIDESARHHRLRPNPGSGN